MGIPLYIFLIIYLIIAGVSMVYALLSLWHVFNFAHLDTASYFTTGIFIGGIVLIIFLSATFILPIDWNTTIELLSTTQNPSTTLGL